MAGFQRTILKLLSVNRMKTASVKHMIHDIKLKIEEF